jgi:hypothetical protein
LHRKDTTRGHTKGLEKREQCSVYECSIKSIFNKVTDDLIYIIYVKLIEPDYFVSIKIVATCTNKQPREKIVLAPYQKFCSWPNSPAAKLWITTKVLTFWVWQNGDYSIIDSRIYLVILSKRSSRQ